MSDEKKHEGPHGPDCKCDEDGSYTMAAEALAATSKAKTPPKRGLVGLEGLSTAGSAPMRRHATFWHSTRSRCVSL